MTSPFCVQYLPTKDVPDVEPHAGEMQASWHLPVGYSATRSQGFEVFAPVAVLNCGALVVVRVLLLPALCLSTEHIWNLPVGLSSSLLCNLAFQINKSVSLKKK